MILLSQVLNGVLLPVVMIIILKLVNRRDLMHGWVNGRFYNFIAWAAIVLLTGLSVALAVFSIFPSSSGAAVLTLP